MNKLIILLTVLISHITIAQNYFDKSLSCFEAKTRISDQQLKKAKLAFPGDGNIDVKYYFLDLNITPETTHLSGKVQIDFTTLIPDLKSFTLDLNEVHSVDSVIIDGTLGTFAHANNTLEIELPITTEAPEVHTTVVYYNGNPPSGSFGALGMQFTSHGNNQPVIWTLSESYDTPLWWPCVDNPADKADSCDVWITLPSFYTAVSQGILTDLVNNNDGTNTAKWKHRYPISQYLISIAASNYVEQKQFFHHSETDSMLVIDYLYPEIANDSRLPALRKNTVDALEIFSEVYGEYPFIKEKYGHAMFGFGGGMEHQTISSMGTFSTGLIAHELAHQWFGDKVTCKTWRDIWVNEGFAEFSSLYFHEIMFGKAEYDQQVQNHMQGAKTVNGSVAIENTSSVGSIFDYAKTYQKGSIILHMLRGVLGNELFFNVLKEFQTTEFSYGAATIEDFKMVAERVSEQDLSYFFNQWLFGTGYPKYTYSWNQNSDNSLVLQITHTGSSATKTFSMPMEVEINFPDGSSESQTVFVDQNNLTIELNDINSMVNSVEIDPNNLILKDIEMIPFAESGVLANQEADVKFHLFPNPSHDILYLKGSNLISVKTFDTAGREQFSSFNKANSSLNIKPLKAGKYFLRIETALGGAIKPFTKR